MSDPTVVNKEVFETAFQLVAESNEAAQQFKADIDRWFRKEPMRLFWPYDLAQKAPNAAKVYAALGHATGRNEYDFAVNQRLDLSRRLSVGTLARLYEMHRDTYPEFWEKVRQEAVKRGLHLK